MRASSSFRVTEARMLRSRDGNCNKDVSRPDESTGYTLLKMGIEDKAAIMRCTLGR
jgi:hypothetical protein